MFKRADSWTIADLAQRAITGRGRTNCVDGSLCTLTTNSGRLYSKKLKRTMDPLELLSSLQMPTSAKQARAAGTSRLHTEDVSDRALVRMAGNGMHCACVGAMVCLGALCLSPR